jgi:uncharacterized membrane protein YhaH (DUF805 family)
METALQYFRFTGRLTRAGFWLGQIGSWLMLLAIAFLISKVFGNDFDGDGFSKYEDLSLTGKIIAAALLLGAMWFSVCVEVRRWHDRGKSGWWFWIGFIPVIGGIWTLIECGFRRGTIGPNQYGEDPLQN